MFFRFFFFFLIAGDGGAGVCDTLAESPLAAVARAPACAGGASSWLLWPKDAPCCCKSPSSLGPAVAARLDGGSSYSPSKADGFFRRAREGDACSAKDGSVAAGGESRRRRGLERRWRGGHNGSEMRCAVSPAKMEAPCSVVEGAVDAAYTDGMLSGEGNRVRKNEADGCIGCAPRRGAGLTRGRLPRVRLLGREKGIKFKDHRCRTGKVKQS